MLANSFFSAKFCTFLGDKGNVTCFQKLLFDPEIPGRAGSHHGRGYGSEGRPSAGVGGLSPVDPWLTGGESFVPHQLQLHGVVGFKLSNSSTPPRRPTAASFSPVS